MAYIRDKYTFSDSVEYEYKWEGKYGARGEKRAPKQKATPEIIARQNQYNRETRYRRTIKKNFTKGDLWLTLTYKRGTRLSMEEVKKDFKKLIEATRKQYRKRGCEFKWIRRLEIGANGGIHIHMICNRLLGEPAIEQFISDHWKHGQVNYKIYQGGSDDAKEVADYLTKPLTENQEKRATEKGLEKKELCSISSSKNLERPKPETKKYSTWTVRKLVDEGPKAQDGFYIDEASVYIGINPFTGLSFCRYTEIRADGGEIP